MSKIYFVPILFITLTMTISVAVWATPGDSVYVKVRASKLRAAPNLWSTGVANVRYGDQLTAESTNGAWILARKASSKGYLPLSAITDRKVVLGSNKNFLSSEANSTDVILAGKGFSKEVEKTFASSNGALRFDQVDKMEALRVSEGELAAFVQSGKLTGGK